MNPLKKEVLREQIEELLRNSVMKVDAYPLPRMDGPLNEATLTPFISTIDLQSGYHQVKVDDVDQDKTAFICPFGTYRYLRMLFSLRNAPATFQRLIDKFRSGLKDVFALSYLDAIIVLSETFEKNWKISKKVLKDYLCLNFMQTEINITLPVTA
ncbi:retrovirus-related Pol polyprotein from transposon 297 [Trichonephila clavipes]|nr:retrovirus-related Pol polyprotein from transposon 297 [Trichonephila clavipes]